MPKLKILITGGAGFQGSHLAENLIRKGHFVSILNTPSQEARRNMDLIRDATGNLPDLIWGSVTDPEIVFKAMREKDLVMHLAARINIDESLMNVKPFVSVNVYGTYNVLEAARKIGSKVIYASSCEIYGQSLEPTPENIKASPKQIPEGVQFNPHSPYGATKLAADRLCYAYYKSFAMPIVIVRPFNMFGERQKEKGYGAVIPIFVRNALEGKPLLVHGDGEQSRDYLYVSDLVDAYDLVIEKIDQLRGQAINFASGKGISINEIAGAVAEHFNVPIRHVEERPGQVALFTADTTKARKLGFKVKVPFEEGLKRYIKWRTSL